MSSPIVAAWVLDSDAHDGIAVFSETHYNFAVSERDRKPFAEKAPTDAEASEAYKAFVGHAGTYTVSGATMTNRIVASINPNLVGKEEKAEFEIQGDRATVRDILPDGTVKPGGLTWWRV